MPVNDELGIRMKTYYEQIPKTKLMRRTPVAIRIDGKAFHTFTKGFQKPFDEVLINSMQRTMKYLCENIQGCVLGYTQSDEITLILVDYKNLNSDAWFDYEVQKMCSIAASMATMAFNRFFAEEVHDFRNRMKYDDNGYLDNDEYNLWTVYNKAINKGAMFDARVFNISKEEVTNLIYWRQLDATRNSIQMVGQANFSHKELHGKSCNKIQDMLLTKKDINWNNFPTHQKRGSCCVKSDTTITGATVLENGEIETNTIERPHWYIDNEIPIFKGEDRAYIDKLIFI
jgi:tRNA(His) 5'-end guanylyltransferase